MAAAPDHLVNFVPLFNGTDFTGWRFGDQAAMPREIPAAWKIENGVIVGTGDPTAILASQWDYGDFELEFEWRALADTVDADVYVHAGRMLDADPIRITKDLAGGPQENDRGEGLYNASATGSIGGGGSARKPVPSELRTAARVPVRRSRSRLDQLRRLPAGQWNYLDIRVEDGVVSTWLNGRPTVDRYPLEQIDPKFPEAGGVGLQAHAPWKKVLFHDIRIAELP